MFNSTAPQLLTIAQQRQRKNVANLTLWTFQGWMAMLLIGAGYAKVAEPMTSLEILLGWARADQQSLVRALGWFEIALGLTSASPLIFGNFARFPLLIGAALISALATIMIVVHGLRLEPGAVAMNLALLGMAAAVLAGRRRRTR